MNLVGFSDIIRQTIMISLYTVTIAVVPVPQGGERVVELGPGAGAITRELFKKYPRMVSAKRDLSVLISVWICCIAVISIASNGTHVAL